MTISYNWLSEYLPVKVEPQKLSEILTSVGLEVESLEAYESIKGGLKGIVVGEVLECTQHPNADKLKLTKVNIGEAEPLNIVCGASNVAAGQKVLVATIGTTIYPTNGAPLTMKAAKIRGEESQGMICAEDELGLGTSHEGIMVLPSDVQPGTKASNYLKAYNDYMYEIGLTPNRMNAMSHLGVARDVCAYLSLHEGQEVKVVSPFKNDFKVDDRSLSIDVTVENKEACPRYAGVTISGVTVQKSPDWLKNKMLAISQKTINNIVDITNFILHETGQPLHAFDAQAITGNKVVVKNLQEGTTFITLDDKERKLSANDLMICNAEEGMCIAGVFGGARSGVTTDTKAIFLESAWFNPTSIRKTSFRHDLRTEAATRFEKGVDISNVVNVLKRAALLIKEVAGGKISSEIIDIYPEEKQKTEVELKYEYLKKLTGKNYQHEDVKKILSALGFEVRKDDADAITVAVPFSNPDISLPADIVEEILRIDGLDNVEFPGNMNFTPALDENLLKENLREKISGYLTGLGFSEIMTNSITNSQYYTEDELQGAVRMVNSLSADLDVMRPSMLETGLESISYNLNRKNKDLQFYEFGKTYHVEGENKYKEREHIAIYITGTIKDATWKSKTTDADFYYTKGIANAIKTICGVEISGVAEKQSPDFATAIIGNAQNKELFKVAEVSKKKLKQFDIKQPVYFIQIDWLFLLQIVSRKTITYKEVSKFPSVNRDLALILDKQTTYDTIDSTVKKVKVSKLQQMQLSDIFESEKLGQDKKSMAISFTFIDEEKTLTDREIDSMIGKLVSAFEKDLNATIRQS